MFNFYYSMLSDREKGIYDAVYSAFLGGRRETQINLFGLTVKRLNAILEAVINDHPEFGCDDKLFRYEYTPFSIKFVNPVYSIYKDDAYARFWKNFSEQIKNSCKTDFEKVKYVHDFMINSVTYNREDKDNEANHNAIGTFRTSKGVCEGIARLAQFLLTIGGVRATYCEGKLNETAEDAEEDENVLHAWAVAEIEGNFYYLDISHDICLTAKKAKGSYRYFLLTHDELLKDRTVTYDSEFRALTRGAESNFYFRKNGSFVTTMDEMKKVLDDALSRASLNKKRGVSVQFKVDEPVRRPYQIPFHKICVSTAYDLMKKHPCSYEYALKDYDDTTGIYRIEFTAV